MSGPLNRRGLLAGTAAAAAMGGCARAPRPGEEPRVTILRAKYDQGLFDVMRRLLDEHQLDVRGKRVLLKPNLVEFDPGAAINTEPVFVLAAMEAFRSRGASHVGIAEGPGHRRPTLDLAEAAGEGATETYDKAIVGLFRLADDTGLPENCLLEEPADGISLVILESAKYPGRPPSASVRCDARASDFLWEKGDDEIWDWMAERLGEEPPFGTSVAERQVKRWRLSEAARPVDAPFLTVVSGSSTLSACGDGFAAGGPIGVENALRSAQALFESGPWRA